MRFLKVKLVLLVVVTLVASFSLMEAQPASAFSGAGAGIEGDPYQITNCTQMQEIENDLDAVYRLTTSLDCSSNGSNVTATNDSLNIFTGIFDGGNNTVTVDIDTGIFDFAGLFRRTNGATITDITVNGSVVGNFQTGGLAGRADDTYIYNAISNATVSGGQSVGGLIGFGRSNTIESSSATGNVTGSGDLVGGLVGQDDPSNIENSFATGNVEGADRVGGLTGASYCGGTIEDSYATGSVTGDDQVGGLSGESGCEGPGATYINSYATGNVEGVNDVGGLIGNAITPVIESYATGSVVGESNVGGLIGSAFGYGLDENNPIVYASFSTGAVSLTGFGVAGGLIGVSSGQMPIFDSYSRSIVTSTGEAGGGLIGVIEDNTIIVNSYSTGALNIQGTVGGLVGFDNGGDSADVDFSFWDTQSTGTSESAFGEGKTTVQMKNVDTFTTGLGEDSWDFESVWGITPNLNNGYPCLKWFSEDCVIEVGEAESGDSDGISDEVEDAAPNGGDANDDGIPDSEQGFVASFVNPITGQYVSLAVDENCAISSPSMEEESVDDVDVGFVYPIGLMNFTVDCADPGYTATVTQYFYNLNNDDFVARKFNPTTKAYFTIEGAVVSQVEIDGLQVVKSTFQITDGSALDADGIENGIIVDPAGLGQIVVGAPRTGTGGTAK